MPPGRDKWEWEIVNGNIDNSMLTDITTYLVLISSIFGKESTNSPLSDNS